MKLTLRSASILSFLVCLFLSQFSLANSCRGTVSDSSIKSIEKQTLEMWGQEVLNAMNSCQGECVVWPKSMSYSLNSSDRRFAVESAIRLSRSIHRAVPQIAESLRGDRIENLNDVLNQTANSVEREHGSNPMAKFEISSGIDKLVNLWNRVRNGANLTDFKTKPIIDSATSYSQRVLELKEKYGADLVSDEVLIGAGFGNLAARVIMDTIGDHRTTTKSLDALSLLHPLTDNALDQGFDVGSAMAKITQFIKTGEREPITETRYENLVLDLLHDIFTEFPRDQHPLVVQLLGGLHSAQLESVNIQKKGNGSNEDILKIMTKKGGYTGLLMAYLSMGKLSQDQAKFFYKSGALFQMGDDLLDVREDLRDKTKTVWTQSLKSQKDFKKTFQAFLKLQEHLELETQYIKDPKLQTALKNDVELGFKFYLMSAYLNREMEPYIRQYLNDKVPLSPKNLRNVLFETFNTLSQAKFSDQKLQQAMELYGQVFDHHFLGGQFKEWQNGIGKTSRPFRISHWNPLFVAVKFESMISNKIRTSRDNGRGILSTMALIEMSMLAHMHMTGDPNLSNIASHVFISSAFGALVVQAYPISKVIRPVAWAWLLSQIYVFSTYFQNVVF